MTASLVWRGLVMKAENPLPFVPVITSCKVIERRTGGLIREIVDKGDTIREVVTFHPQRMVKFERMSGRVLGTILNEIIEDADGDLALKFTFTLTIENVAAGSAEEKEFAAQMEDGYLMAVRGDAESHARARREKERIADVLIRREFRPPRRRRRSAQSGLLHQRIGLGLELRPMSSM